MSDFFEDFTLGEVHIRDKYQFELKSEYLPVQTKGEPSYTTELYLFAPASLQVNDSTYTKQEFYRDQTSMIRYKTPLLSLERLLSDEPDSPLQILRKQMATGEPTPSFRVELYELKLFSNVVRSRIRDRVNHIIEQLGLVENKLHFQLLHTKTLHFLERIREVKEAKKEISKELLSIEAFKPLKGDVECIDEFISITIQHYLTVLLSAIRGTKDKVFREADALLTKMITEEDLYRRERHYPTTFSSSNPEVTSRAIWRLGELNKYVFEVLFLNIRRKEPKAKFQAIGSMVAAGLAMFVYVGLLAWQGIGMGGGAGTTIVFNSTAFILLSVLLYIVKDRLKESMKSLSTKLASHLYPDYTTDIQLPESDKAIGKVSEFFSFLDRSEVGEDVLKIRERGARDELQEVRLLEKILYFRKDVEIFPEAVRVDKRLRRVNDIFRFNVSQFLFKASDAKEDYLILNPMTGELEVISCPKIYHVYLILKKTFLTRFRKKRIDFDTFRIVIDKEGIRRIDKV